MANDARYKNIRKRNMKSETRNASTKPFSQWESNNLSIQDPLDQNNLLVLRLHSVFIIFL